MTNVSTNYSDYALKNSQLSTNNSTSQKNTSDEQIEVFGNDNPVQQEQSSASLRQEFASVQEEQGFFGKLWDGIKSLTGIGLSSGKVENAITQYENGEISYDEAMQTVQSYQQKQDDGVNIITNVATGLATTCLTFGTGGLGLLFGGLIGGAAKAGLKTIDRASNGVAGDELNGKEIIKDVITGGVDGTLNVLTGGMAGKAGSTLGKSILGGAIQGAKAGAISSGAAGATEYITDSILDEDKEFNLGEFMSYTATNAVSGGVFGGAMGGITGGIKYGRNTSKTMYSGIESENTIKNPKDWYKSGSADDFGKSATDSTINNELAKDPKSFYSAAGDLEAKTASKASAGTSSTATAKDPKSFYSTAGDLEAKTASTAGASDSSDFQVLGSKENMDEWILDNKTHNDSDIAWAKPGFDEE